MAIKQLKIDVNQLSIGMYVSQLDRPWTHTPFPLQGFEVRSIEDIDALRRYCGHVFIDTTKGKGLPDKRAQETLDSDRKPAAIHFPAAMLRGGETEGGGTSALVVRKGVYATTAPLRTEIRQAQVLIRALQAQLDQAARQMARGQQADYRQLRHSVERMVASVLRCPDAFTWLVRLRRHDQSTQEHSLRSALWAVQFARFIGMDKREIETLCMGTLLKDIGKLGMPAALLRQRDRSPDEEAKYRQFVALGVEMLRNAQDVEPRVISVVRYHCERQNGSGFPEGLKGNKIPLLARIAGIASVFDALSNPLESSHPVAPSKAVSLLYDMRGREFQEDLVVQFIQSIGLYPAGTLVELTTGDLGVVVEQHPGSRLTPQVAVVDPTTDSQSGQHFMLIDLRDQEAALKTLAHMGGGSEKMDRVAIARDLEPTSYDIDINDISVLFMQPEAHEPPRLGLLARMRDRILGSH